MKNKNFFSLVPEWESIVDSLKSLSLAIYFLENGFFPNLFFPLVPSGINIKITIKDPIKGMKLRNKCAPDLLQSCSLLIEAVNKGIIEITKTPTVIQYKA